MTDQVKAPASVEELRRQLAEALERQAAVSQILETINSSGFEIQPVFDAVVQLAAKLCNADGAFMSLIEGDGVRYAAAAIRGGGPSDFYPTGRVIPRSDATSATSRSLMGRALGGELVHVADITQDPELYQASGLARRAGARTALAVPIRRHDHAVGAVVLVRTSVRSFDDREVQLVRTFADQAAIALDNFRLFNETKEALEQQTATSQVLQSIGRSAFDLQAVLDTVLENAARLCSAQTGFIFRFDGSTFTHGSSYGYSPELLSEIQASGGWRTEFAPDRTTIAGRVALERDVVQIQDVLTDPELGGTLLRQQKTVGFRTMLGVPMLRDRNVIGVLSLRRNEVRPFNEREVQLVRTFADQAAIAIENVRLFNETKEALEQQTATAEVLKVISGSAFDLQRVLDIVVSSATTLCGAERGTLWRLEADGLFHLAAYEGGDPEQRAAQKSMALAVDRTTVSGRVAMERRTVHVADVAEDPEYRGAFGGAANARAMLGVPLLRDETLLGALVLTRTEPRPFTDREIQLVRTFADQAVIALENVRLFNETKEALDQQTAISEILQVISNSPTDVQPVLDAIARSATRFCGAEDCSVALIRDGMLEQVAQYGPITEQLPRWPVDRGSLRGRAIVERQVVHVHDMQAESEQEYPIGTKRARALGMRSAVAAPLLREGVPLGAIALRRTEVKPFTEKQIALLRTFADQAAIAIENVRLFNETKEALEQQRALAEILEVISRSTSDIQPVLDVVATSAARLTMADGVGIFRAEGDELMTVAFGPPGYRPRIAKIGQAVDRQAGVPALAFREGRTIHIEDVRRHPDVHPGEPLTRLAVPIVTSSGPFGVLMAVRVQVRPFSPRDIRLIETFAAQAAIAIENVRLFNETNEALEQQRTTSGVLELISRSAFDLEKVLYTLAEHAVRLSGAEHCDIIGYDGGVYRDLAHFGAGSEEYLRVVHGTEVHPGRGTLNSRVLLERKPVQIVDVLEDSEYEWAEAQRTSGFRTLMGVPILRDGVPIGSLSVWRSEVKPFTDRQIQVLVTFADQAAIAIENTRLFNETKEALEQQTATGEVLKAISRSPFALQSVLDTVIETAAKLCGAEHGYVYRVGDALELLASYGTPLPEYEAFLTQLAQGEPGQDWTPSWKGSVIGRVARERRMEHFVDLLTDHRVGGSPDPEIAEFWRDLSKISRNRSAAVVPLLRGDEAIGVMALWRERVAAFTERELQLVQTFADQAAIAIENARLFNETKEALAQQQAVSEVLQVISRAAFDLRHVLDTLADSAARLCEAEDVVITRVVDGQLEIVSHRGAVPLPTLGPRFTIAPGIVGGRAVLERRPIQVLDAMNAEDFPGAQAFARETGQRTCLAVPLLREGAAVGAILLRRLEVRPFTERQIKLLETFADQAVIAIENVRLFNETKEALDRQSAVAEVLATIGRSAFDLQAVLDAVIERATKLCDADQGFIYRRDGEIFQLAADHRITPEFRVFTEQHPIPAVPDRGTLTGRVMEQRRAVMVADVLNDPDYTYWEAQRLANFRSLLNVPLLREGEVIGVIGLWRTEPRAFTEQQAQLVSTFADQVVIAIESARSFAETRSALERQTAVSDVLATISRSVFDLEAILETVIQNAVRLCRAKGGLIFRREGDVYRLAAMHGGSEAFVKEAKGRDLVVGPGRGAVTMRAVAAGAPVQIEDVTQDPEYSAQDLQKIEGFRTVLGVPLFHKGEPTGAMSLWRNEVRPFSTEEIELVRTFADQAAIAIENVRLFNETKEALERQTATSEVLEVISRSAFDVSPVLQTVADRASRLGAADHAVIVLRNNDMYELASYVGRNQVLREKADQRTQFYPSPEFVRAVADRTTLHVQDARAVGAWVPAVPGKTSVDAAMNARTELHVPLVKDGQAIGVLVLARERVAAFSGPQIEIVETFAKQATIAIQNVQLFKEIQDKSRQLEVASRHKSEFLANMSHELRTPLNAIIGFTDVMLQEMFGPLNEKQKEYLDDVRGSGTHLLTLINEILDLSKIEAGRLELEVTEFSLPDALENALTLVRERAARHGISIAPEVASDVGTIAADERKVTQILVNLLSNAVKFTPDGGWVSVSVRRLDSQIQVAVRDTGIGVAPEDQERIFEEFQQVGRDPDKSREGTGLGLTLAKRFVELHGGRIWVESEVGKGSTFTFAIPVRQTAMAETKA